MRALIVASQVAVTCVLVIGAVLLARSFGAQIDADRGYEPSDLLTAAIPFPVDLLGRAERADAARASSSESARPASRTRPFGTGLPLVSAGGFSVFNFHRRCEAAPTSTWKRIVAWSRPSTSTRSAFACAPGGRSTTATPRMHRRAVVVNRTFVAKYLDNIPIERAIGMSLGTGAVRDRRPARLRRSSLAWSTT